MAQIFKHPHDANLQAFISDICRQYGYRRDEFLQMEEDIATGRYMFAFKARQFDAELVKLADAIRDRVGDSFTGAVTRAAVPELSKDAGELADLILNPKVRIVYIDAMLINRFRP